MSAAVVLAASRVLLLLLLLQRRLLLLVSVWSHFVLTGGMIIFELATGAVDLSPGAAIRKNPGSAAAAAASTTTALAFFAIVHISYWYYRIITTAVTASAGTGFASHCIPWYESLGALPGDCSTCCDDI